jgi:hypothetical protein
MTRGVSEENRKKEGEMPGVYKSEHKEENRKRSIGEGNEKMTSSEKVKKEQQDNVVVQTQEIPLSKMKNINEIIRKIGLKQN